MTITSFAFFVFLAVLIPIYYFIAPKKFQWVVLLAASYIFYYFAGVELFVYILFTTFTVYISARWISKLKDNGLRKLIIVLTLICNFGFLAFFKWYNTVAGFGNEILTNIGFASFNIPLNTLLLPLGISFYTFQAAGYLIDVYRGDIEPEKSLPRFALFISFFPQLVQGPISRHSQLADQLYASRNIDFVNIKFGFQLILWGLFKKLVIADRLILMETAIFVDTPGKYTGLYIIIGLIARTLKLYGDFSGGVDVARGAAQMLGITMPENFNRPFFASSLPDYWRRWHMTLNQWWRDYLFYPVSFSKPMTRFGKFIRKHAGHEVGKVISVYMSINIVRVVNAMWHGANLVYIASGFYHGILIVLGLICVPLFKKIIATLKINVECASWKFYQMVRTFFLVCFGSVFVTTGSIPAAGKALKSIVMDFNPWILNFDDALLVGLTRRDVRIVLFSLLVLLVISTLQERGMKVRETLDKQNIVFQWLMMMGGLFIVLLWGQYGVGFDAASFIYGGF